MKTKHKQEGHTKIPLPFDEALPLALKVKPPTEGWAAYEKKLRRSRKRRTAKDA